MQCRCDDSSALVDISQTYAEFVTGMLILETGDWVKLLRCSGCGQLWRTDEYDKYQTLYAFKLATREGWKSTDIPDKGTYPRKSWRFGYVSMFS